MSLASMIIFSFIISTVVAYLGILMIPKMFGTNINKILGTFFIIAAFIVQCSIEGDVFYAFGYVIPLIVGAYIATGIKKDFLISKITKHTEWNYAHIANGLMGIMLSFV